MKTRMYLRGFEAYLADMLKIDAPKVRFLKDAVEGTLKGGVQNDGSAIKIYAPLDMSSDADTTSTELIDVLFRLAHEMRHVWQMQHAPELLAGYKPRTEIDLIEYNRQAAELDAHAFAALIMEANFGLAPQFIGLDDGTKERIYSRKKEIYEEMRRSE